MFADRDTGVGNTAKGAGNTVSDTAGSVGGKKQDGQNPLGL